MNQLKNKMLYHQTRKGNFWVFCLTFIDQLYWKIMNKEVTNCFLTNHVFSWININLQKQMKLLLKDTTHLYLWKMTRWTHLPKIWYTWENLLRLTDLSKAEQPQLESLLLIKIKVAKFLSLLSKLINHRIASSIRRAFRRMTNKNRLNKRIKRCLSILRAYMSIKFSAWVRSLVLEVW